MRWTKPKIVLLPLRSNYFCNGSDFKACSFFLPGCFLCSCVQQWHGNTSMFWKDLFWACTAGVGVWTTGRLSSLFSPLVQFSLASWEYCFPYLGFSLYVILTRPVVAEVTNALIEMNENRQQKATCTCFSPSLFLSLYIFFSLSAMEVLMRLHEWFDNITFPTFYDSQRCSTHNVTPPPWLPLLLWCAGHRCPLQLSCGRACHTLLKERNTSFSKGAAVNRKLMWNEAWPLIFFIFHCFVKRCRQGNASCHCF